MAPRFEDSVLKKWLQLETGRINREIVEKRKSLSVLLREEVPSSVTKGGDEYRFNPDVIHLLGDMLPKSLHHLLKLPILFYFSMDVPDSCFITDETAVEALQILGDLSELRRLHEGKLWVSRALVYSIIEKYPTAVQIVMR